MATTLVFETHSTTEDNERGIATGWLPGRLSDTGRENARQLGTRHRDDGIDAVFTSDLARAVETATIAFGESAVPILHDWRLRECDYGDLNGTSATEVHGNRSRYLDTPYPSGESWRQAVARVARFVDDVALRCDGSRVVVIGHVATRWGLECTLDDAVLEDLIDADFAWQEGWEYVARP
jgi:broad specificity phosphatase PhoE